MSKKMKFLILLILLCLFPLTNAWSGKASKNDTVYIEKYGKKIYHREWCPDLKFSKKRTTVGQATAQGYAPCSHCKPPVVSSNNSTHVSTKQSTLKSIRVGSTTPLSQPKNTANTLMEAINIESTNCPARYFSNKRIGTSNFKRVNDFLTKAGKEKIVLVMYKEKPNMTIRKNNSFVQTFGRPNTDFVDECTIMFDLISLNLTLQAFESKVHEYDNHLALIKEKREVERKGRIKRQKEATRLAQLEIDRAYQDKIVKEEAKRRQEAKRQAEWEAGREAREEQKAKRQAEWEAIREAKRQVAKKAATKYKLFGIVDSELVKSCHDSIYLQAKNSARIVSTYVTSANDRLTLNGRAQLQNGYGAWLNHSYACVDGYGLSRTDADLQKGWEVAIAAERSLGAKALDLE